MFQTENGVFKLTSMRLQESADDIENMSAYDLLKWAIDTYGLKIGLSSSFGAEDVVLIDMMLKINKAKARIFTLDTGRLNQETYDLMDNIRKKVRHSDRSVFPR